MNFLFDFFCGVPFGLLGVPSDSVDYIKHVQIKISRSLYFGESTLRHVDLSIYL